MNRLVKNNTLSVSFARLNKSLISFAIMLFATNSTFVNAQSNIKVATARPALQEIALIKAKVQSFLEKQSIGLPGRAEINVQGIDPNIRLSACDNIKVFLPAGSRVWGKTSVGVRCNGSARWTIYVQANVNVFGEYMVASGPLSRGTIVTDQDLSFVSGDLTKLPTGIFTDADQAIGRIVKMPVQAGSVLRQNVLKMPPVVQRGQTVVLTSAGNGFKVAAEGKALGDAIEGQVVQVKVASGQIVAGIAQASGQIEVKF